MTTETTLQPEVDSADPLGLRDDGAYVFHYPPKFLWTRWPAGFARYQWDKYHLYFHVPFCRRICTFCTFERQQLRRDSIAGFLANLEREMQVVAASDDFSGADVQSIYFGGGTASLLPNEAVASLLERIRASYGWRSNIEITLECEPGTKSVDDFAALRRSGVNRISIGFQALQDHHLKRLNRSHDVKTSLATYQAARDAGFENVHVDLMYGLPAHTLQEWEFTLEKIVALRPSHISAYRLIVFDNELLARSLHTGDSPSLPAPGIIESMRRHCVTTLQAAGYHQYSLTEFSLPGFECQYVISNWNGSDYLGFGPGGYSRHRHHLWEDDVFHEVYAEAATAGRRPVGKFCEMTSRQALLRDLAMGLCLLTVNLREIQERAGVPFDEPVLEFIAELAREELVLADGFELRLTAAGIRHATGIMRRIISL